MVALNVWPTDAADGSVANEARWRKMGRIWTPSAVIYGTASSFFASLAYPNLTVQPGVAWVDGHYVEMLSPQVLTVTANGLVVIRFDPAANTAELIYRDGVTTPAQSPTGVYELPMTRMVGGVAVDARPLYRPTGPLSIQYTPVWTGQNVNPSVMNGTITGSYTLFGDLCYVYATIGFGTQTSGGIGYLSVSLPFPTTVPGEQYINCKLFVPGAGGNFLGQGWIVGGQAKVAPMFPTSQSNVITQQWRSVDENSAPDSGVPKVGGYNVQNTGNFVMNGVYRVT